MTRRPTPVRRQRAIHRTRLSTSCRFGHRARRSMECRHNRPGAQMSPGPEDQWRPPEPPGRPPRPGAGSRPPGRPRWMPLVIVGLAVLALLAYTSTTGSGTSRASIDYSKFLKLADEGHVSSIKYEPSSGHITGELKGAPAINGKTAFSTQTKPDGIPDADLTQITKDHVAVNYQPKPSNLLSTILSFALVLGLIGALWWFIARRAGPDGAVMNIGRSRQGVQHRQAEDDVQRRRRLRRRQGGDRRGRRLLEGAGQVQGHRAHPQGCAARRSAGNRQDADRARRRR